jgi:hypothetical protein
MTLETALLSKPVSLWRTRQAIVFDWYDSPRAGLCALAEPRVEFAFDLLDERPTDDGLDDRLFRLSELPDGTVDQVLALLTELGRPTGPVWVPVWQFQDEERQRDIEDRLRVIESGKRPTGLIVSTRDMTHFLGCWDYPTNGTVGDWFAALAVTAGRGT